MSENKVERQVPFAGIGLFLRELFSLDDFKKNWMTIVFCSVALVSLMLIPWMQRHSYFAVLLCAAVAGFRGRWLDGILAVIGCDALALAYFAYSDPDFVMVFCLMIMPISLLYGGFGGSIGSRFKRLLRSREPGTPAGE